METINFTPLGFSDLTSDEAFVVSVFRHWQSCGSTCKEAEGSLTEMLKNDRLREGLLSLFDLFGTLPDQNRRRTKNDSSVLTSVEEALLDEIGSLDTMPRGCVKAFQQVLEEAGTTIRPASEIPRSGYDHLAEAVDRKTAKVFDVLYPGFSGSLSYQS
ncbi:hypothetical protein KYK30_06860 [Shinella yambaruensis]|uniref:Uncharacterized protein n=1 Tax=Shinella yambaruensis TaxID=415996 RepID=A0ABQ5ZUY3_9HYPH|nr:hypothetical protein [Shinella yambaruensis]MCJ8024950.1 hypothetical protein [Shinella yambaruensis]MCU7979403.1 hypothetical protein [Shinella yambaruensis]GLR54502.1 hypothetical protein GCM10007923_57190 [Shinella yambaruensis]